MDVVEAGERRSRTGLVVGVAAVLVAGLLAGSALRDDEPRREPPGGGPATPSPSAAAPAPSTPGAVPPGPPPPSPLIAQRTTEVTGRVAVVDTEGTYLLDLSTGEREPVAHATGRFAVTAGVAAVVFGGPVATDFPPSPHPVYAVEPGGTVRRIGNAAAVVPAADGQGVWAQTWTDRGRSSTIRYLGLDGRAGPAYRPGSPDVVRAALPGGQFVTAHLAQGGLDVWELDGNRRVHREPWATFVAANADRALWGDPGCDCPVQWFDFPNRFSGDECACGVVEPPEFPQDAVLSPDGQWFAYQTTGDRVRVTVCPVERGRCVRLRNAVAAEAFQLAWLHDSSALVLATSPALAQVAVWRPEWPPLVRLVPGEQPVVSLAAVGP